MSCSNAMAVSLRSLKDTAIPANQTRARCRIFAAMARSDAHTLPEDIRILVVEDDAVEMTHLTLLQEELGYEVAASVDNALDAMVAFIRTRPDLVMLDIHL